MDAYSLGHYLRYEMRISVVILVLLLFTSAVGAADGGGYRIYRNPALGFELHYPAAGVLSKFGPKTVRIYLPFPPGTTLIEKYLLIEPAPAKERSGNAIKIGGMNLWFEYGSEGAAGSIYDYIRCIATLADGRRIALTFVLHSVDPGVFDSPPPPFNRAREVITFWMIIASLRPIS